MTRPDGPADAQFEALIQRALDGRLSQGDEARLAERMRQDPAAAAEFAADRQLYQRLQASVPEPDPARLAALLDTARAEAAAPANAPARPLRRLAAALALFAVGIGTGIAADRTLTSRMAAGDSTAFAEAARAAHALYVPEVRHPVEVAADQRDHLQAWLSKRLGAPIIAPQLGDTGYRLIGGRLLPSGEQAAALFMYENEGGDRISVYATHGGEDAASAFRFYVEGGFTCVTWQDGPWQYALIGDLPRDRLDQIAREVHEQMT